MGNATNARTVGASITLLSGIMFGMSALVTVAFGYALIAVVVLAAAEYLLFPWKR